MNSPNITVGSDPEFFLVDENSGAVIPSSVYIPGNKHSPYRLGHGFIHKDNVMLELNPMPADNAYDFWNNIECLKNEIYEEGILPRNVAIMPYAHYKFEPSLLLSCPTAFEFGCEPDFCAWANPRIPYYMAPSENPDHDFMRFAGGHIHVGVPNLNKKDKVSLIKVLDSIIGLHTTIRDSDTERLRMYGTAGRFRYKKYGVEYRTPSNFWTANRKEATDIFNLVVLAVEKFPVLAEFVLENKDLPNIINNKDVTSATALHEKFLKIAS